jgi:hypothetical protein
MKRLVTALILVLAFIPSIKADDISDNFTANLNDAALDALAQDLGTIVGSGSFHHGKALGFPLGFDVGVHVPVVGIQNEDVILRDNGSNTSATWGQIEVGLPMKLNVIARGGKVQDADMIGGGLRLGLFSSSLPGIPSVSVSALYSQLDHDYFDMKTYSGNAVLSFDLPFVDPYIGAGYDSSELEPTSRAYVGATPGTSTSLKGKSSGLRTELGINLHVIPFTYINAGIGTANGETTYHGGAGVRF